MPLWKWKQPSKRTYEDKLLLKYWRKERGLIVTEVRVGKGGIRQWPHGAKSRFIDAIRITHRGPKKMPADIFAFNKINNNHEFAKLVKGAKVEVVEAKRKLNRLVLGQAIVGEDLLRLEFRPGGVRQVVVCAEGDPVLEYICKKRQIKVRIFKSMKRI